MNIIISSLFRVICTTYLFKKIMSKDHSLYSQPIIQFLVLIFLFASTCLTHKLSPSLFHFVFVILVCIFMMALYKTKFDLTYFLVIVIYAIFSIINYASSLIIAVVYGVFYYNDLYISDAFLIFLAEVLTCFLLFFLSRIKRVRSSTKLLFKPQTIKIGATICTLILLFKLMDNIYLTSDQYLDALPLRFVAILLAFLLFTWWQKQITKSYIEKLRKLELQTLYDELEEKDRRLQKLAADNEALSRIIHKDNKLIPAMENAVLSFLSSEDYHNPEKTRQYGLELTQKLQAMTRDRQGILDSYDNDSHKLKLTGHVSLDAILVYMKKKADASHIRLECKHTPETIDYLLTKISEDDLTHLLSDLMENAIISMKGQENGRLQITFGKLQKEAYISIADSGIPFDIATLHSFGLQAHTTHEDSGGSGIGLMDIWKIKRKYRATIQIQEYGKNTTNFTKRILFSFNSKNHYVIQSFRHAEISNTQTRGDLYIIPAETKEKNEGEKHEGNIENLNS